MQRELTASQILRAKLNKTKECYGLFTEESCVCPHCNCITSIEENNKSQSSPGYTDTCDICEKEIQLFLDADQITPQPKASPDQTATKKTH